MVFVAARGLGQLDGQSLDAMVTRNGRLQDKVVLRIAYRVVVRHNAGFCCRADRTMLDAARLVGPLGNSKHR
jgi:hypothetical protein